MTSIDIHRLRAEFPVTNDLVYFNTGTVGICPVSVADAVWKMSRQFEVEGVEAWGPAAEKMEAGRRTLATFLDVDADNIAFTRNATDGVNLVVEGVDWAPGDEVLLSDEEHPAMRYPWTYLMQRKGVVLNRFKIGMPGQETLDNLRAAITPNTRLVATSHVSSTTGKRVPAAEIAALCAERGIWSLFDGAQATGQFPISPKQIGADFYTGNLHKWLHGPKGTGFLYVAPTRLQELTPVFVGSGTGSFSDANGLTPADNATRFEYGTRDFGRYGGLIPLFDWYEQRGFEPLWAHMQQLTATLKRRLAELPYVKVHTPESWDDSSAMTTFSVDGISEQRVYDEMWDKHRIRLRTVREVQGNRVSTSFFNTEDEIDLLIDGLSIYGAT